MNENCLTIPKVVEELEGLTKNLDFGSGAKRSALNLAIGISKDLNTNYANLCLKCHIRELCLFRTVKPKINTNQKLIINNYMQIALRYLVKTSEVPQQDEGRHFVKTYTRKVKDYADALLIKAMVSCSYLRSDFRYILHTDDAGLVRAVLALRHVGFNTEVRSHGRTPTNFIIFLHRDLTTIDKHLTEDRNKVRKFIINKLRQARAALSNKNYMDALEQLKKAHKSLVAISKLTFDCATFLLEAIHHNHPEYYLSELKRLMDKEARTTSRAVNELPEKELWNAINLALDFERVLMNEDRLVSYSKKHNLEPYQLQKLYIDFRREFFDLTNIYTDIDDAICSLEKHLPRS